MADTRLYELLARIRADRSVALAVRDLTTVNGRDYEGDPRPVTAGDASVVAFVESFNAAAVADREKARAELQTARAEHNAAASIAADAIKALELVVSQRDETIRLKDGTIATLEGTMGHKDGTIAALEEAITARDSRIDELLAEIETLKHPPRVPTILEPAEFLERFNDAELDAIQTAEHPIARKAERTLFTRKTVDLESPLLAELMTALVLVGLLTEVRAAEILARSNDLQ